jgi:hypothetical protein
MMKSIQIILPIFFLLPFITVVYQKDSRSHDQLNIAEHQISLVNVQSSWLGDSTCDVNKTSHEDSCDTLLTKLVRTSSYIQTFNRIIHNFSAEGDRLTRLLPIEATEINDIGHLILHAYNLNEEGAESTLIWFDIDPVKPRLSIHDMDGDTLVPLRCNKKLLRHVIKHCFDRYR